MSNESGASAWPRHVQEEHLNNAAAESARGKWKNDGPILRPDEAAVATANSASFSSPLLSRFLSLSFVLLSLFFCAFEDVLI